MSSGITLLMFIVLLVLSIIISKKSGLNLGFLFFLSSFILGYIFVGSSIREIIGMWKVNITFQLVSICAMFYYLRATGAMENLAAKALYATRKAPWTVIPVVFIVGVALNMLGTNGAIVTSMLTVFALPIVFKAGIKPLPVLMAITSSAAGTFVPWGICGLVLKNTLSLYFEESVLDAIVWRLFFGYFITAAIAMVIFMIVCKGFKVDTALVTEKPAALNKEQKESLLVVVGSIIVCAIFSILASRTGNPVIVKISGFLDIQVIAIIVVLYMTIRKIGDPKKMLSEGIPWGVILLCAGAGIYVQVAAAGGVTELMANWMAEHLPTAFVAPGLTLLAGFLSLFAGAVDVVFPLVSSVAAPLATTTGLNLVFLMNGIAAGGSMTGASPFSTGGASVMGFNPVKELEGELFKDLLIVAICGVVIAAILSVLHVYPGL